MPIAPCSEGLCCRRSRPSSKPRMGPTRTSRIMAMPGPAIRAKRPQRAPVRAKNSPHGGQPTFRNRRKKRHRSLPTRPLRPAPSDLERSPRLRPCRPLLPRCCPSGDSICAAAGTSTGTAFFGAEENPHGHHPLRRVGANGYLGRRCPPQHDKHHGTRGKAKCRSGASGRKSASAARS